MIVFLISEIIRMLPWWFTRFSYFVFESILILVSYWVSYIELQRLRLKRTKFCKEKYNVRYLHGLQKEYIY
jgi:hypothetical protein